MGWSESFQENSLTGTSSLERFHLRVGRSFAEEVAIPAVDYVKSAIGSMTLANDDSSFLDPRQPLAELANQYLSALLRYDRH